MLLDTKRTFALVNLTIDPITWPLMSLQVKGQIQYIRNLILKEPCHAKLTFTRWKYTSNGNFFTFIIFFKAPPEGGQRSQQAFIWVLAGEAKIGDNRGFSGKLFFLCWMVMIFKCHISSISYARLWTKAEAEKPKIKVLCRRKCCFFLWFPSRPKECLGNDILTRERKWCAPCIYPHTPVYTIPNHISILKSMVNIHLATPYLSQEFTRISQGKIVCIQTNQNQHSTNKR